MRAWELLQHPPFQAPRLLAGPHIQTIVPSVWPRLLDPQPDERHEVPLADGDRLVVMENRPRRGLDAQRAIVMVHGLSGCYQSAYMSRLAKLFISHGYRTFRINLRGCGPGEGLARKGYHSGRSDDFLSVLQYLKAKGWNLPTTLMGFSLGANILLKMAGERGSDLEGFCDSAVAVSPPLDLTSSSQRIRQPENQIYDRYFTKRLLQHINGLRRTFPEESYPNFPDHMNLFLIDELYTSRANGFADAADYYRKASSGPLLKDITVKTLLVTAQDDPIVDYKPFLALPRSRQVRLALTDQGGHVGFMGRGVYSRYFWLDSLILAFLKQAGAPWPA